MTFQPATLDELNDRKAKSCPKITKLCRHDHKGLVNTSTEGIDESLHGLGGIEEFPSKNGVFSITQKSPIEGTRDSGEFSTRLDGLEAPQGVKNHLETTLNLMHKEHNGRTKIHHTKDIQSTRLIQIQKPRGHKEERASFPDQS